VNGCARRSRRRACRSASWRSGPEWTTQPSPASSWGSVLPRSRPPSSWQLAWARGIPLSLARDTGTSRPPRRATRSPLRSRPSCGTGRPRRETRRPPCVTSAQGSKRHASSRRISHRPGNWRSCRLRRGPIALRLLWIGGGPPAIAPRAAADLATSHFDDVTGAYRREMGTASCRTRSLARGVSMVVSSSPSSTSTT